MTKEEKRRLEQEYWKSLHDENGNLVSVSKGKSQSISEYYRMNFPPNIADEMIKRHESMMNSKNYLIPEMEKSMSENSIDFDRLKYIRYEDL